MVHRPRKCRATMRVVAPQISVRVPCRLKCTGCEYIIVEGRPLKMIYEKLGGASTKIGSLVHRLYTKCPQCGDALIIRTELMYNRFVCEHGCSEERRRKVNLKYLNKKYAKTLDPFKFIFKHFVEEDRADQQDLVECIEKHLSHCKTILSSGLNMEEKLLINTCNDIRKECRKGNSKTPLLRDNGGKTSPFIQKLMRVQSKDLESFFRSIQEVLYTKMFEETAYGYRNRLIPIILRYKVYLKEVRKKKVAAREVVDLEADDEPEKIPFLEVLEAHEKACTPTARNVVDCPHVRVPFSMKCTKCRLVIPKGQVLPMRNDIIGIRDFSLIRVPVYRLYFECPNQKCTNKCIFRSNLQQTQFIPEFGVVCAPDVPEVVDRVDPAIGVVDLHALLEPRHPLDPDEDGLIQVVEDYLAHLHWAASHGRDLKTILERATKLEIEKQEDANYQAPLFPKSGRNVKFSDTLLAVPDYHFTRFTTSLRCELISLDLIREKPPSSEEVSRQTSAPVTTPAKKTEPTPVEAAPKQQITDNNDLKTSAPVTAPVKKAEPTPIEAAPKQQTPDKNDIFAITPCRCDLLPPQMMIVPTSVQCKNCGNPTFKNQRVEMRQEWIKGLRGLPVNIYRLYMRCPECTAHITVRSELIDKTFRPEYGGTAIEDQDRPGLSVAAFDPMNLIGRWKDSKDNQQRIGELEGRLNELIHAADKSKIMKSLKERIRQEMQSEGNHPQLAPVAMPDVTSNRSPFVSYFLSTPLHTADLYLMRQQLMTDELKRVMREKLPKRPCSDSSSSSPSPSSSPVPHVNPLKELLARYRPTDMYENLFKTDRRRDTGLRRVELVERRKKNGQLRMAMF